MFNKGTDIQNTVLGKVAYREDLSSSPIRDIYLNDVINTFFSTDWKEMYGLDIKETMQLEFSKFIHMRNRIKERKALEDELVEKEKLKKQLENKL